MNRPKDSRSTVVLSPKAFQSVVVKKGRRQVGLRVEIGRENTLAKLGVHPRQVIDE